MIPFILLLIAFVLVVIAALMAADEAALSVSSRRSLIEEAESTNTPALALIAKDALAHGQALVFVRVFCETAAAVFVTVAFTLWFGNIWWAMLVAVLGMTVTSFILVGASPRAVGRKYARSLLKGNAGLIHGLRVVLGPLPRAMVTFSDRVTPGVRGTSFDTEEQLLSMVDEAASRQLIEKDDRDLIHSVFDFTDTRVRAVMVPRTDMVTVDSDATARCALDVFLDKGISRVPLVDDEADDVVGVLYLKDLVRATVERDTADSAPVRPVARKARFVPESMRAETLLQQMKLDAVHLCIVVDEYGGVSGLVTLEDLIEELVGEIADEYDGPAEQVTEISPGRFSVSARMPLAEAGELVGVELDDDDVDSVGGMLGKALGRVPEPGATAMIGTVELTGGASAGRRRGVTTVIIERVARTSDADQESESVDAE